MDPGPSRRTFLGVVSVTAGAVAGCAGREDDGTGRLTGDTTVYLTDEFAFRPTAIEIAVGESVVWENAGSRRQTVTAYGDGVPAQSEYFASGGLESETGARIMYPMVGGLGRGERYRNRFDVPGTYRYFSIPSEGRGMTGRVVVTG